MNQMRYTLLATTLALTLMGAGCATSTDTTTTTNLNTNTTVTNTNATNAAGGTSLSGSADANVNDTPVDVEVDADTTASDATVNETKTFDVVASQFAFTPETITVNQGDTVVINLTTTDVPHGFSLPDFGVSETLTPGKTKTVEFVADQTGTFSFTCSVVCGAGHNSMRGTLVVN